MDPSKLMQLCIKYKMPVEALVFLTIIQTRNWTMLYRYITNCGKFDMENIDRLIEAGWIRFTGSDPRKPMMDEFEAIENKIPKELILTNYEIMARQFWDQYPAFHVGEGKRIPLKTGVNFHEFKKIYARAVTVDMHKDVMKAMFTLKKRNMINFGPHKFITGEYWNAIDELTNINYAGPKSH